MIYKCLHAYDGSECECICKKLYSSLKMEFDIRRQRRILQTPAALAEPGFIYELRSGASLRAIRRFFLFYRMNLIVENALDTILAGKE